MFAIEPNMIPLRSIPPRLNLIRSNTSGDEAYRLPHVPNMDVVQDGVTPNNSETIELFPEYFVDTPILSTNMREVEDVYSKLQRNQLLRAPRGSQIVPYLRSIRSQVFRNDFFVDIRLKNKTANVNCGSNHTIHEYREKYHNELSKITLWGINNEFNGKMRKSYMLWLTQGRFVCEVYPPLACLSKDELPQALNPVPAKDTCNPIIDKSTKKIFAFEIMNIDSQKVILLKDAMIYGVRYDESFGKRYEFHGKSLIGDLSEMNSKQEELSTHLSTNPAEYFDEFRGVTKEIKNTLGSLRYSELDIRRDQKIIAQCFADQLLTPLLSHLSKVPMQYLPVECCILP